jgi:chromosome segregation ATPase
LPKPEAFKQRLKKELAPVIERVNQKKQLRDRVNQIRDKTNSNKNELANYLTPEECEHLNHICDEIDNEILNSNNNNNNNKDELKQINSKLNEKTKPLIQNAKQRKQLKNKVNHLKEFTLKNQRDLKDKLNDTTLKQLNQSIENCDSFLTSHPNASQSQIDQEKSKLNKVVQPILNHYNKVKEIEDEVNNTRNHLKNNETMDKYLTPGEKKAIEKLSNELLDNKKLKDGGKSSLNELNQLENDYK